MRLLSKCLFWGLLLGMPSGVFASEIVFSNLQGNSIPCGCSPDQGYPVGTFAYAFLVHNVVANGFRTPATGDYTLDSLSVPILIDEGNRNSLLLSLYTADAKGLPNSPLEEFTIENQMEIFRVGHILFQSLLVGSVLHPILKANTAYWLVATTPTTDSRLIWFGNHIGDVGPVTMRFNDYPFDGFRDDLRAAFAVYGTPIQGVPEPSAASLWGIGLGLIGLLWLKQQRCRSRRESWWVSNEESTRWRDA